MSSPARYVYLGRLKAYLNKFDQSLEVFSQGLEQFPSSPHLYRHRAHRFITLRDFDNAILDFEKAIELTRNMPDEIEYYQPQVERDIAHLILDQADQIQTEPTLITPETLKRLKDTYKSTLKSSIYYHYGLAYYLKSDFEKAAQIYRETLTHCVDDDMRAATTDWLYMSLRRLGQIAEAAIVLKTIHPEMHIVESSYFKRLLMYQGLVKPEELLPENADSSREIATQGYGLGNWYFYNNDLEQAKKTFQRVLNLKQTSAFGHIAAELDIERHLQGVSI